MVVGSAITARMKDKLLILCLFVLTLSREKRDCPDDPHLEIITSANKLLFRL